MHKDRMEAFSDGVIAIIITIMVLELRPPHGSDLAGLVPLAPVFASYVLSFVYVGIYWSNHHHMLAAVRTLAGPALWANLHLLFWLSLVPFATAWMGEHPAAPMPVAAYGFVLLMAAIAYYILQSVLIRHDGRDGTLARAVGADLKGKASPLAYITAIAVALAGEPWLAQALFVLVALVWLAPDRRIERTLEAVRARGAGGPG